MALTAAAKSSRLMISPVWRSFSISECDKVADAVTQTELDAKGYLTAEAVTSGTENGTIAVNGSDVAVKGLGSAAYTTAENYIIKPTEQPNTFGEYVLILNINEAGESEGYSWLDTQDFIGGVDEW